MFVSHRDGNTTSTIRVNTGGDMLLALVLISVGLVLALASIQHPALHYIRLLLGVVLLYSGYVLARRTSRLIGRAKRAYHEGTKS
jgi:hypothetical protein